MDDDALTGQVASASVRSSEYLRARHPAAYKNVDARKTKIAAPVTFNRWLGGDSTGLWRRNSQVATNLAGQGIRHFGVPGNRRTAAIS